MVEQQQLSEKLQRELEMLAEYQTRNRQQAEAQRNREKRELDERVAIRRTLLQQKVCSLTSKRNLESMVHW